MQSSEIRRRFLEFFEKKGPGGHKIVPSSSLIPDDPSVLLTTAGMQQFKLYYTGEADALKDFGTKNTASVQKSFRTSDIDEVGDETHLTFFEMLGNFSFGGYFKKEAITYAFDFMTQELKLPISYVTIFEGSPAVPKDEESKKVWNSLGITDIREQGMADVFWGPTGSSGPCGPTTEIYCRNSVGQDVEIWNLVFNEYFYPGSREELNAGTAGKKLEPLKTPGVDTGMGLERLAMVLQKAADIFETDLFKPILEKIEINQAEYNTARIRRIVADHARASAFLIADGVRPSNKGTGYILRRILRRASVYGANFLRLLDVTIQHYGDFYDNLNKREEILDVFNEEYTKFIDSLDRGLREAKKLDKIDARAAFRLYESYGLPYEVIKDHISGEKAKDLTREKFEAEMRRHQETSRAGAERKFGGHGLVLDTGELKAGDKAELEKVTRLHTATHLLNAALHQVLGDTVEQRGSDITVERARFDFRFPRKVQPAELQKIEDIVNANIAANLPVSFKEMDLEPAKESGALYFSQGRYPARVKVYTIGRDRQVISRELCGGPHVENTGEIGKFKITKEESSSAGVRRMRMTVQP